VHTLKQKITELHRISKELEPPEILRNNYLNQVNNFTNQFINDIERVKAYSNAKPNTNVFSINNKKKTTERNS